MGHAHAVLCQGFGAYCEDNQSTSLILNEQALAEFREVGDRYFMSVTLRYISDLEMKQGNLTQGEAALREAAHPLAAARKQIRNCAILWSAAHAAQRTKKPARAVHLYWAAKKGHDSTGSWKDEDESDFKNCLRSCRPGWMNWCSQQL